MKSKIWRYVAVLAPLLLVSACVAVGCEIYQDMKGDPEDLPDTTVSQTDAVNRVDELVHEVLGLLQIHVTADYEVFGMASDHFAKYFETVAEYAKSKGWTVHGESPRTMALSFKVDEVFSVGMQASDRGGANHHRQYKVHLAQRSSVAIGELAASVRVVTCGKLPRWERFRGRGARVDGGSGTGALGPVGYAITGSGGGGAGGQFVFANLAELDGIIADLETLRDDIREDGAKLRRARQLIEPPGEDVMSRMEAKTTVYSLDKAIEHNMAMFNYAEAEIAKMLAARTAYSNTDDEGAARLRTVDEG